MMVTSTISAFLKKGWVSGFIFGSLLSVILSVLLSSPTSPVELLRRVLNENNNNNNENDGHDYENHESHEELEYEDLLVVCIVLCLIALTILFESGKHYLEHSVTESMEPIVEKLFGEMTVLGFLSMITFLLDSFNFFGYLSEKLFGSEDEEEEILEVFEDVHFAIFFIMVFFMIQVLVLIYQALQAEALWKKFDKDYQTLNNESSSPELALSKSTSSYENKSVGGKLWLRLRFANSYISLLPFFRSKKHEVEVDRAYFGALRDEFITERSMKPPYLPADESQRVNNDFAFGRYLGLCLVRYLAKVVDVTNTTLLVMALGAVLFYVLSVILQGDNVWLAWSWLTIGWIHFLFNVYFEQHILEIRRHLVPESSPHLAPLYSSSKVELKEIPFKSISGNDLTLPAWCSVDLEHYSQKRSLLNRMFAPGKSNRQDTLYWLDRLGPTLYLIILQCHLIFIGLDCAMQIVFFLPNIYHECSTATFATYFVLVLLSVSGNMLTKKHLVANLAVVCSLGSHRNINAIADVYREGKTENLVRCFLILYRLHSFVSEAQTDPKPISSSDRDHYSRNLDPLEIAEVSKTLQNFMQTNGNDDCSMCMEGFKALMLSLEGGIPDENLEKMMASIDLDSDGTITKDEFLQWYSDNMVKDNDALENAPRVLFDIFDEDHQKEITISQFKAKLDTLQMIGFTTEEQIGIIKEIDRDGSGTISQHEFEILFKKFPPKELLRKANENKLSNRVLGSLSQNMLGCPMIT